MKTLKKSLCLILALVFVLGLCTFGAGAAFTDEADVNYDDAVTVMNGLGILKGYEDGSFQPAKTVTRAEAATMITKMILGEAAAAKLPAASVFADVPASNWAAPFINYCATKGIIKGYGDGNYGPNDPVTGLQLAKMLLVACGYGEMNEFAPDTWEIYTFTYAIETGIYDNVDTSDFSAPATREECALYVFNTLVGINQVKYDVDFNDYDVKAHSTFGEKTYKLDAIDGLVVENQATGADYTVIAPSVYNDDGNFVSFDESDLINFNFASGKDAIGHKVVVYYNTIAKKDADGAKYYNTYLDSDISTVYGISSMAPETLASLAKRMGYPKTSFEDVLYFANGVNTTDLYSAMKVGNFGAPGPITYFTNSVYNLDKDTEVKSQSGGSTYAIKVANGSSDNASTYLPVDGLIVDEDGEIISAIKNTYTYAKVTDIDEDEGIVEFKWCNYAGSFTYSYGEALLANCYEGIAEDDFVIVEKYGDIYTLTATTTMTTKITQTGKFFGLFPMFNNSILAEYTTYCYWNDSYLDDDDGTYAYPSFEYSGPDFPIINIGDTVKFYIGKNGAAFAAVKIDEAVSDYVFVTNVYTNESKSYGATIKKIMAQGVNAEGTEVNLLVGYYKDATNMFGIQESGASYVDDYYTFSSSSQPALFKTVEVSDETTGMTYVKLYHMPSGLADVNDVDGNIVMISDVNTYKGTESHIKNQPHYLTGATKYIYVTGSGDTLKIAQGSALRGTATTTDAYYVAKPTGTTAACDIPTIWVYGTSAAVSTGSFVFAKAGTAKSGSVSVNGAVKDQYSVYVDGVSTTITLSAAADGAKVAAGGFYSYTVDSDGLYTLEAIASGYAEKKDVLVNYVSGSYVMVNDVAIPDDIDVADFELIDLNSYGYQDAKNVNHKITDADSLAEAKELGYEVKLTFVYDVNYNSPVGVLYVTY